MKNYLDLLQDITDNGCVKGEARDNMPTTRSLFGRQMRHNLQDGFPLLTTKKMFWNGIVTELFWFLRGETNIKSLVDNGSNFWNQDSYNFYLKKVGQFSKSNEEPPFSLLLDSPNENKLRSYTFEEFILLIKDGTLLKYEDYTLGDCGFQYGKTWRNWGGDGKTDQIMELIKSLRNSPMSRRHIISAWDPANLDKVALHPCHALFQFNCRPLSFVDRAIIYEKKYNTGISPDDQNDEFLDKFGIPKHYLDCQMYQRSADTFLGVPFNIASYALLTHIMGALCNMIPGEFIHSFGDAHIYSNHEDQVAEQLTRGPYPLPKLDIMTIQGLHELSLEAVELFFKHADKTDFQLVDYKYHPAIKAELSTGMKTKVEENEV